MKKTLRNKKGQFIKGTSSSSYWLGRKNPLRAKLNRENYQKEGHPRWKGGKPKCEVCGKELSTYGTKRCMDCGKSDEHREKLATAKRGGLSFEEYFWSKVDKQWENGCWNWKGYFNKGGYGMVKKNSKYIKATKIVWEMFNGKIPKGTGWHGICVLHKCDNRACVNPNHLFLGTHTDNMRDMWNKKRRTNRGEHNPNVKLGKKDVIRIRELYIGEHGQQTALGKQFGVGQNTIYDIVNYRSWQHI